MKIIVFCGPTISSVEAAGYVDAEFLPPAKHGDVISCAYNDHPDVIVFIDGIFVDDLAVWNNEINEALNMGITVYGASAMGAIRAAEMKKWGVVGVGRVFEHFADATIEADDEVFCDYTIAGDEYIRRTVSTVNLRYILAEAVSGKVMEQKEADGILEVAKTMFFRDRTVLAIVESAVERGICKKDTMPALIDYISASQVDIQKHDAIACLKAVSQLSDDDLQNEERSYQYDLFFEALYERDRGTRNGNAYHSFYKIANDFAFYSSDIEATNDAALNRKICALVADNFNIEVTDDEVEHEKKLFLQRNEMPDDEQYNGWLLENDMTDDELTALMLERVKVNKLQNWYRTRLGFSKNTRYLLEELKINNQYTEWKKRSIEIQDESDELREEIAKTFNDNDINRLASLFLRHNPRPWKHAPYHFINKVGLSMQSFKYLLARNKALTDAEMRKIFQSA